MNYLPLRIWQISGWSLYVTLVLFYLQEQHAGFMRGEVSFLSKSCLECDDRPGSTFGQVGAGGLGYVYRAEAASPSLPPAAGWQETTVQMRKWP